MATKLPPINITLNKCLKCGHRSVKPFDSREVIGVTQCSKTKEKAVMSRLQAGVKCLLCNYSSIKTMIVDSKGHKVA